MNRLNELNTHAPFAKKEFDRVINTIASWKGSFSNEMEFSLTKDLQKLSRKWEKKLKRTAGWGI